MEGDHPLRALRIERNLTQDGLARLLGVSRTTVARWESRARKVDRRLLSVVKERTGLLPKVVRPDLVELLEVED